ncbi:hypothetical protein Peur_051279 [Populus x canadensis]
MISHRVTIQFMAAINGCRGSYAFVQARRLRYGNCFKTTIFGVTQVFVPSTESAKTTILHDNSGKFTKRCRYLFSSNSLMN